MLKKYFVAGLNILGRAFACSPIGLIVRGIGAAIDLVSEKWGALKEAFTGGMVGKLVTSIFGDDEDEQPQKVKKNNREITATEARVGKSAEKTLARPSVEQKKVKSSFGDSVKASTKATPHETSIAGVDKQGNGVEAKQSSSSAAATSSPKSLPAKADSKQQVITNYVTINVTAGEGQDSKEIADDVHDKFVTSSSGAMYDE